MLATQSNKGQKRSDQTVASMKVRQAPLYKLYNSESEQAIITDRAETYCTEVSADQPLYTNVNFGAVNPAHLSIGIHKAVGGAHDRPNPGEILCAAIASCLDSTTRIIANRMGIVLTYLQVEVAAQVDVRGTLKMDINVPVGFQSIDINVNIQAVKGVSELQLNMLIKAAEQSCVVIQTLLNPAQINITRQ